MNDIITPCSNAGHYPVCQLCQRANWSWKERVERIKFYIASWKPNDEGECAGFVEVEK